MSKILDELSVFCIDTLDYPLIPQSETMIELTEKRRKLDVEASDFVTENIAEWERYGFVNGFAYAMRLMKECLGGEIND